MQVRLLGPLEVSDGERTLPLGRGKPRDLLAVLALERGRVVSTDRLIDALWGERPPPTAAKALQVHVRALRGVVGADRIVTRAPGYALRLADGELDVARFEALVDAARAARAAGDAAAAAELLGEALGLWRGPPLADVAYASFAHDEAMRLEELRVAATEERLGAELEVGRHAEVVPALERLVAEQPLRERPRALLMRALYRSGRQADALAAYRDARATLVDELGLEPGRELRDLERAILDQDPALGAPPAPEPVAQEPAAPERKLATLLVAELALAPGAPEDPERVAGLLDAAAAAVADELAAAGAHVERGGAGAVRAAFGVPSALEDHAARALAAAESVHDRLGRGDVRARIGLESGELLAAAGRLSGAPVTEAARLAGSAAPGATAAGERARAAAARVRAAAGVFVGRGAELELLAATWARVAAGARPHLLTVVGDAGVGKTSLVRALRERIGHGAPWLVGRCPPYGRAVTYRPLAEILRARLGLTGAEPADEAIAALGDRHALAPLLGLAPPEDLHPWEARERLREAWVDLMDDIAAEGPAVVVVEDLHWADEALLELLERAVRDAAGPLLVVTTARPELLGRRSGWAAGGDATRLELEPLAPGEAAVMLERLAPDLPAAIARRVLDRAEGNPFYVEEVLASLMERGALRRTAGGWEAQDVEAALAVSDSVQAVIAARIDLLPAPHKRLLQAAAVIGRSFPEGALAELVERPPEGLAVVCERGFARRTSSASAGGGREHVFKHALTREVAYRSLPVAARAWLHARFAEWVEASGGDEDAAVLAHHYAQAVAAEHADLAWSGEDERAAQLRAKAVRSLRAAAEQAIARYGIAEALELLATARELQPEADEEAALWQLTARAHRLVYDIDEFRAASLRALALAPSGPAAGRALAELAYAGSQAFVWREPPPADVVRGWVEAARREAGDDDEVRARTLFAEAMLRPQAGVAAADEAVALAERHGDPDVRARSYQLQVLLALASRGAEAAAWADRGMALMPEIRDPNERTGVQFVAVFALLQAGRIADAVRIAADHDAAGAPLSPHHAMHGITGRLLADCVLGRWQAVRELADRTQAVAERNAGTPCQFNWRGLLMAALGVAATGEDGPARRLEARAREARTIGGALECEPAVLRLALLRQDRTTLERALDADPGADTFDVDYAAARLDALAVLGDRARLDAEAEAALAGGGYARPFALRALGVAHRRPERVAQAREEFSAMGLRWRAEEVLGPWPARR